MISFSPDDEQAKMVLARSGIEFETLDVAERGGGRKLAAWVGQVRSTPTLVVGEGRRRKYEVIRAITEYVNLQGKIVTAGREVNLG